MEIWQTLFLKLSKKSRFKNLFLKEIFIFKIKTSMLYLVLCSFNRYKKSQSNKLALFPGTDTGES